MARVAGGGAAEEEQRREERARDGPREGQGAYDLESTESEFQ